MKNNARKQTNELKKGLRLSKETLRELTVRTGVQAGMLKATNPSASCGYENSCPGLTVQHNEKMVRAK